MSTTVNASIVTHFQTLEDPRIERAKKHRLLDIRGYAALLKRFSAGSAMEQPWQLRCCLSL